VTLMTVSFAVRLLGGKIELVLCWMRGLGRAPVLALLPREKLPSVAARGNAEVGGDEPATEWLGDVVVRMTGAEDAESGALVGVSAKNAEPGVDDNGPSDTLGLGETVNGGGGVSSCPSSLSLLGSPPHPHVQ